MKRISPSTAPGIAFSAKTESASLNRPAKAVCVLGMHRSGTSLISRAAQCIGVDFGPEQNHLPANEFNRTGYLEDRRVVEMNDEILKRFGGSWSHPPAFTADWQRSPHLFDLREKADSLVREAFTGRFFWGVKDPRICLTLPFWLDILPEMDIVLCLRQPMDVSRSLQERDQLEPLHSSFLWKHYMASALVGSAGRPMTLLSYEDFFDSQVRPLDRLEDFLKGEGLAAAVGWRKAFEQNLRGEERHFRAAPQRINRETQCDAGAKILYERLMELCSIEPRSPSWLDRRRELEVYSESSLRESALALSFLSKDLKRENLQQENVRLLSTIQGLEAEIARLQARAQSLDAENGRRQARLQTLEEENARRLAKIQAMEVDGGRWQARIQTFEEENARKMARIQALETESSRLAAKIEAQRAEIAQSAEKKAALTARLSGLEERLAEISEGRQREKLLREQALDSQTQTMASQAQLLKQKDALNELLRGQAQAHETRARESVTAAHKTQQRVQQLEQLLRERANRLHHLSAELTQADSRLAHLQAQLMALRSTRLFRYTRGLRALWRFLRPAAAVRRPPMNIPGPVKIRIRQIYYADAQKSSLLPEAEPYFCDQPDAFLENGVLVRLHDAGDHHDCDYFGVLSWRFRQKVHQPIGLREIQEHVDWDPARADVYSFFRNEVPENIWQVGVRLWHPPLLMQIAQKLLDRLAPGTDAAALQTPVIYCNFWVARREVFDRYVREWLAPAMELMRTDPQIRALCEEDSGYSNLIQTDPHYSTEASGARLTPAQCQALFGRPYYTYHPFVCERLFSTWLALNPQLRLSHLI